MVGYMINLIKIVNERIIPTLRVTDNFWSVYLVKFGVNKKATIKFRNGTFLDVTQSNYEDLVLEVELQDLGQEIIDKMNVSIKEDVVTFISEGKSITADRFSAVSLVKEFYLRLHEDLPVRNKVVLDIGCYVGDSPLYYIIKGGALKVYGYEINKKYAAVAKNNVRYNNLEDRIKYRNSWFVTHLKKRSYRHIPNCIYSSIFFNTPLKRRIVHYFSERP